MTVRQLAAWSNSQGRKVDPTKHILVRLADGTNLELSTASVDESGRLILHTKGLVELVENKVHHVSVVRP
jgi:hypothetical protein